MSVKLRFLYVSLTHPGIPESQSDGKSGHQYRLIMAWYFRRQRCASTSAHGCGNPLARAFG